MSKKDELQAQRNELFNHSEETLARIKEIDKAIAEAKSKFIRLNSKIFYDVTVRAGNINGIAIENDHGSKVNISTKSLPELITFLQLIYKEASNGQS